MRVVAPLAQLHGRALSALAAFAPQHELVDVSGDDECYWRLLAELWAAGDAFVVVEHDIEIHAAVLPQFETCNEPWCTAPYVNRRGIMLTAALGCARFSGALMRENPDLIRDFDGHHWQRLDSELSTRLRWAGHAPHVHRPPVTHHFTQS